MLAKVLKALHAPIYQSRIDALTKLVIPFLRPGDSILDIGCGNGVLGQSILAGAGSDAGLKYVGAERSRRFDEPIEVVEYDGQVLPFPGKEFDVAILADVLHHADDPRGLLAEACRVARRHVIVKDHKCESRIDYWLVCAMDWGANHPHDVKCLYDYPSLAKWREMVLETGMSIAYEQDRVTLYARAVHWVFPPRLQYFCVLDAEK
ncbi:MAG: methyltransferase domain-containing protein [Gammaproteobacteria bacterium]|nr:methyltransferase domain-containing protein [Gammaproteobacteria bacterium]